MRPETGFHIAPNWHKIGKATMTSKFVDMTSSSIFFYVKFSYWFKFHVNIITGSVVMTSFLYKGLTRNPEIGNTPLRVLPNIWRLRRVRDTKFGTNVSKKLLLKFHPIQTSVKSVKGRCFQSF